MKVVERAKTELLTKLWYQSQYSTWSRKRHQRVSFQLRFHLTWNRKKTDLYDSKIEIKEWHTVHFGGSLNLTSRKLCLIDMFQFVIKIIFSTLRGLKFLSLDKNWLQTNKVALSATNNHHIMGICYSSQWAAT